MTASRLRFDSRVAVITGAARGLGREYATLLADLGAKVVVNDLGTSLTGDVDGTSPAEQAAAELCASGAEAIPNGSDVGDPKQAHALIDEALAAFGRIDILVTNAGIVSRGPFATTSAATFDAHLRVHLHGTFNTCRAVWPTMLKQRYGRIVTVVSAALFGVDNLASYASAKGGILGLTKSMAYEGAADGIRVNGVAPVAYTRMTAASQIGKIRDAASIPSLSADRVAATVAVLAHEQCPTTGELYAASGTRVSRIFFGETAGYSDQAITPDHLLDHWAQVMDLTSYEIAMRRAEGQTTERTATR
jgi:NAD(P)-dependent dehydrogenase (short-subunit alcohol dehydrogenase family)